jgi:hypothetical protein
LALCTFAAGAIAEAPPSRDPGIGGTGHQPGEGNGIGGTGAPQARSNATGIIGTVTGFGSIFVNGFEVGYSDSTPTKSDLGNVPDSRSIRVGQVVEIEAEGEGKQLRARKIGVRFEVAGPIEVIDHASGNIRVLGQTVAAGQSIIGPSPSGSLKDLAVGDAVHVSGLRREDAVIVASRIDKAGEGSPAWLRGRVEKAGEDGFILSGIHIGRPASDRALAPAVGEEAGVLGAYSAGTLRPAKITRLPKDPFAGHIARLSIEGFVRGHNGNERFIGGLNIGGMGAANFRAGDRAIAEGKIGDHGRFILDTVRPAQFNRGIFQRGGRAAPPGHKVQQDGRPPAAKGRPGSLGAGGRQPPHRELHRDGKRWKSPASPRRGPNRKK